MPSLYRDAYGTQDNMKMEKEITGGFVILGTIYLIHPDKSFENVGHASASQNDLQPRLDVLGVSKGSVSLSPKKTITKTHLNTIKLNEDNKIFFNNIKAGEYSFDMYNLSGQIVQSVPMISYSEGSHLLNIAPHISSGTYLLRINFHNNLTFHKFRILKK